MRRTALFLLTLHLAVGSALAQNPAPTATLEIAHGDRVTRYSQTGTAADPHQGAGPIGETLVNFDPQHAEVAWSQNHWQLIADGHVLKDFGRREVEARLAVRLVRDLHLTQHGVIGSPEPIMEYWLSNGHAPHGTTSGLHLTPVDTATLKVDQAQGQWCVRDSGHVLFNFRTNQTDAKNALAIIRKYGFTQIGTLGAMGPSMIVMLGQFNANNTANSGPHLTHQSPLHPATNDPKTAKQQPVAHDTNAIVTPAIAPLRSAVDAHKQKLNEFGHPETVDVLPTKPTSSRSGADMHVQQASASAPGEAVQMQSGNSTITVKHTQTASPTLALIDRMSFDWRQYQVRSEKDGQFALAAGSFVLARFKSEHDARLALAALQHYRFTELDHIGRPQPYCSYFLCNGQAPRGQFLGMRSEPFSPEKLGVAMVDNHWAIMASDKPLLHFGDNQDEARVMLEVMQRQQFDRLCHIGDEHGLTFFARSH